MAKTDQEREYWACHVPRSNQRVCRGARPRGVCRAGQPARAAGGRNQQSPEAGRMPCDKRARHCRDLDPDPGPGLSSLPPSSSPPQIESERQKLFRYSCQRARANPGSARPKPCRYRRADQSDPIAGPQSVYRPAGARLRRQAATARATACVAYRSLIPLEARILFVVALLKSHVVQVSQERHLRAVGGPLSGPRALKLPLGKAPHQRGPHRLLEAEAEPSHFILS
jgi:hypothetical protein